MKKNFPRSCRLRKTWEYQQVWKMGCKLHTPHFILLLAENSLECSRLGLTVSRKVGNAVARNKVKRNVREYFRQNKHLFSTPVDVSIVAKRGSADLSCQNVAAELRDTLQVKGYANG